MFIMFYMYNILHGGSIYKKNHCINYLFIKLLSARKWCATVWFYRSTHLRAVFKSIGLHNNQSYNNTRLYLAMHVYTYSPCSNALRTCRLCPILSVVTHIIPTIGRLCIHGIYNSNVTGEVTLTDYGCVSMKCYVSDYLLFWVSWVVWCTGLYTKSKCNIYRKMHCYG